MFERFVRELAGDGVVVDTTQPIVNEETGELLEGKPRITLRPGVAVILGRDELEVTGAAPELDRLVALGPKLRRIHDLLSRFPRTIELRETSVTASLDLPTSGHALRDDGLWATITIAGDETVTEEHLLVTSDDLAADDFPSKLTDLVLRLADLESADEVRPEDLRLHAVARLDEATIELFAALGVDDEDMLSESAKAALSKHRATFEALRPRYTALYRLPLPSGLVFAAALVEMLGELEEEPPAGLRPSRAEPGWDRGERWLDASLSLRSAGLLDFFAPGGLERKTTDGLDGRLDMRFRRDAPQFVTFLGGNSDGDHWGFWYDSPEFYPVIARNFARDSAETDLADEETIPALLRSLVRSHIEEVRSDDEDDSEERLRTLLVVDAVLAALEVVHAEEEAPEEPLCPWPRTDVEVVGSPALALALDEDVPGLEDPTRDDLLPLVSHARDALEAGEPARAMALGLYLHWRDADDLREEAAALLRDAYRALGFAAFEEILDLHVRHRDLRSVGVYSS